LPLLGADAISKAELLLFANALQSVPSKRPLLAVPTRF
jgi:hypothetical protein